jgi:hypothetical protein
MATKSGNSFAPGVPSNTFVEYSRERLREMTHTRTIKPLTAQTIEVELASSDEPIAEAARFARQARSRLGITQKQISAR